MNWNFATKEEKLELSVFIRTMLSQHFPDPTLVLLNNLMINNGNQQKFVCCISSFIISFYRHVFNIGYGCAGYNMGDANFGRTCPYLSTTFIYNNYHHAPKFAHWYFGSKFGQCIYLPYLWNQKPLILTLAITLILNLTLTLNLKSLTHTLTLNLKPNP